MTGLTRTWTLALYFFLLLSPVVSAATLAGKKILYIDSYHAGYAWSDGITEGIETTLADTGIRLAIHRMDTKRLKSERLKQQAALAAKALIEQYQPDVIIASDDNAAKYLIAPYYSDSPIPVVFCGINWDATVYGFPTRNITGMIEANDVDGLVHLLQQMNPGGRIGFIGGDTLTNRKEVDFYVNTFGLDIVAFFARDFAHFQQGYRALQEQVDSLIFYNFIAIDGWDHGQAVDFLRRNTRIPTGTFQSGVLPYAVIGYLKVPQEQGVWAATAAMRILGGTPPSAIPVINNSQARLVVNRDMASAAGLDVPFFISRIAAGEE